MDEFTMPARPTMPGIPAQGMTPAPAPAPVKRIGAEEVRRFLDILQRYKGARATTERRIVAAEEWWKLHNEQQESRMSNIIRNIDGFSSASSWLHNIIVSKHADAMDAYPEPVLLPREPEDRAEANVLSKIVPCIMEQNDFEDTYDEVMWQKLKTGTGAYKIFWDKDKLNGLGDISIVKCNLLNLYWEPGITDIQQSRYLFHTELRDNDELMEQYPQLEGKLRGNSIISTQFLYDDHVDNSDKSTVVDVYYHRWVNGRKVLHYVKFVADEVLVATEDDPMLSERGLYDHGLYPYEFDPLFPVEGSPCGYGFVDIEQNAQTVIDLLNTSIVRNALVGSIPRFFVRQDGGINEEDFLDLSKTIIKTNGQLGEDAIRQITSNPLNGTAITYLNNMISELRETSGNTETSTGTANSGVTAASAIAALQEASGKGSRDSTRASYRSYKRIVNMVVELIRQFYDTPRSFRIVGAYGQQDFITYTNSHLVAQQQGTDFGIDMGYRLPVFDIRVEAQKKNAYTSMAQNEMALQFFNLGFFNPQLADQAISCIQMMDFDSKDEVMQRISQNGTMFQMLAQYMQLSLELARIAAPEMVPGLSQAVMQSIGVGYTPEAMKGGGAQPSAAPKDETIGETAGETRTNRAREKAANASQPGKGRT